MSEPSSGTTGCMPEQSGIRLRSWTWPTVATPESGVWSPLQCSKSPDPEDSQRFRRCSVRFERGADSDSVDPARNQVEHAGRSQVNVRRSSNTGIDRIAPDDGMGRGVVPAVPATPKPAAGSSSATRLLLPAMSPRRSRSQWSMPAIGHHPPRGDEHDRHAQDRVDRLEWRLVADGVRTPSVSREAQP
jgi:hypothetical protein